FFFFNDTATTEIYTLSLHDALPITRHGIVSPRRNAPSRGVAPTTTPNQRPRISQPSMRTSAPVSSARHSCHRSSCCTRPATAARCGRAPPSRRAAISTSAGVRTLTTTAWAYPALDDHRDGEAAVRRAVSRLECGAQNAPRLSPASGRAGATDLRFPARIGRRRPVLTSRLTSRWKQGARASYRAWSGLQAEASADDLLLDPVVPPKPCRTLMEPSPPY